jgi:hypothetical protein
MEGTGDHHVKQNKPDSQTQVSHVFSHVQNLDLKRDWKIEGGLLERKGMVRRKQRNGR